MVHFRRNRVPGETYFFTVTLRDRRSQALTDHIGLLREAFRTVRSARPFEIIAVVMLPEHIHAVIRLPDGDVDCSGRWRAIKGRFSRALVKAGVPLKRDRRGEYDLWCRRFWGHSIRDERDLETHATFTIDPAWPKATTRDAQVLGGPLTRVTVTDLAAGMGCCGAPRSACTDCRRTRSAEPRKRLAMRPPTRMSGQREASR